MAMESVESFKLEME